MLLLFKVSSVILFCMTTFFNVPINKNSSKNTIIDNLKIVYMNNVDDALKVMEVNDD